MKRILIVTDHWMISWRLLKEEMMILTEILRGKIKIPGVFLRVSICDNQSQGIFMKIEFPCL